MSNEKVLENAISLLRSAVKDKGDNIKGLDSALVQDRMKFQEALSVVQNAVRDGVVDQSDINKKIGLVS